MTTAEDPVETPSAPVPDPPPAASVESAADSPLSTAALVEILRAADALPSDGPVAALPSGEMDITIGGKNGTVVHLPRPLFGQMKVLIRAEGRVTDALRAIEQRNAASRNKLLEDVKAYEGNAGPGNVELSVENLPGLAAIRDESRQVLTQGDDETAAAVTEFWQLVFATLLDGVAYDPDKWPADLLEPTLPKKAIAHWRYAQPGPG